MERSSFIISLLAVLSVSTLIFIGMGSTITGMQTTEFGACTDTDEGIDKFTRGSITYDFIQTFGSGSNRSGERTHVDQCLNDDNEVVLENGTKLREHYCDGTEPESTIVECTEGCDWSEDGARCEAENRTTRTTGNVTTDEREEAPASQQGEEDQVGDTREVTEPTEERTGRNESSLTVTRDERQPITSQQWLFIYVAAGFVILATLLLIIQWTRKLLGRKEADVHDPAFQRKVGKARSYLERHHGKYSEKELVRRMRDAGYPDDVIEAARE